MFEWVYFSAAESVIENRSVYGTRLRLGERLAVHTSRTAAIALAESLGLPYREGLIKNRYVHRSFILKGQESRDRAVELKLSPVPSEIEDKNILLVDDSIVRGTTSKKIIQLLKNYGAREISLAVTCPPLRHPCYYGIDFPDPEQLVARKKNPDQIAVQVGANLVLYLEEEDLNNAINAGSLCAACVSGQYPTSVEAAREFTSWRYKEAT